MPPAVWQTSGEALGGRAVGVIHPILAFALGLLLGAGLLLLAIVWMLGSLVHRLSDEQLVALFRARGRRKCRPPAAEQP